MTPPLVRHFAGVDVLAIESNYCPDMQRNSGRPLVLQERIMGGAGHLSNHESLEAVHQIGPREHVVLLHLSRQCNRSELVASMHDGADYTLTITDQHTPSRWIRLTTPEAAPSTRDGPGILFSVRVPSRPHDQAVACDREPGRG